MRLNITEKTVKKATIAAIIYLLAFGIIMAIFPIRPFWNDEWRLLYNLKFKSESQLWGRLDLLQECPRIYLVLTKKIISFFDYNYISLRLPSLVISGCSILFCFYLKDRIYPRRDIYAYLFILILISSQTFTDYMGQVKQYEMDIFLCLLVLWQFLTLLDISAGGIKNKYAYLMFCLSFLAAPFFSYMYPIAFAPVLPVILYASVMSARQSDRQSGWLRKLSPILLPLAIGIISISIFYFIDIRHVMANDRMYASYREMLGYKQGESHFIENFWNLFSLVGSGFVYEIIFGVTGIAAFGYQVYRLARIRPGAYTKSDYLRVYSVALLLLTLALFLSGRLMGSVARLVVFTVPAIALLIVSLLEGSRDRYHRQAIANWAAAVLFAGLFGNIATTCIGKFSYPEYVNRIKTYWNTSEALKLARRNKIPVLITDGLLGDKINDTATSPGKIARYTITADQIAGTDVVCPEVVLKVNPEYKTWDSIPVYYMPDAKWQREYFKQLPSAFRSAIACDGINITRLSR